MKILSNPLKRNYTKDLEDCVGMPSPHGNPVRVILSTRYI